MRKGTPLLLIDDSIQRAVADQQQSQAQAALALLNELKAEPRSETMQVAVAQVASAQASLKTAQDTRNKQQAAYDLDSKAISKDALDSAVNAEALAQANLEVAERQYELTKAGAWVYDIQNQEKQSHALENSYWGSNALLAKYTLKAPNDGVVMAINSITGSYVSSQGVYNSYTQGMEPVLVLGAPQTNLHVRCYIDEILVPRLPPFSRIKAQMSIRGSTVGSIGIQAREFQTSGVSQD